MKAYIITTIILNAVASGISLQREQVAGACVGVAFVLWGAWVHYDDWLKLEEARFALEFRMELATKRNEQLRTLLDEEQRDANRYKWLRDVWWLGDYFDTPDPVTHANSAEEFDEAIDEARIPRAGG